MQNLISSIIYISHQHNYPNVSVLPPSQRRCAFVRPKISVDVLKHINIQMSTRRCQVFGNTCVISENLLRVYSHTEALYCVK